MLLWITHDPRPQNTHYATPNPKNTTQFWLKTTNLSQHIIRYIQTPTPTFTPKPPCPFHTHTHTMKLAGNPPLLPKGAVVALPRPLPIDMMLMHHNNTSPPAANSKSPLSVASSSASSSTMMHPQVMLPITERERIYLKCRVCLCDIHEQNNPNVHIFSKDFLDEKIRRYLYVNVSIFVNIINILILSTYIHVHVFLLFI